MKRPVVLLMAIALGAAGWFFLQHFDVHGLDAVRIRPKESGSSPAPVWQWMDRSAKTLVQPVSSSSRGRLRIAAWDLDSLAVQSGMDETIEALFARVVRQFDLLALQGLKSVPRGILLRLADAASDGNQKYAVIFAPAGGSQLAFIINTSTVVCDPDSVYTVVDPDQLLTQDALVGWFRAANSSKETAFTFSVVNFYVDPAHREREIGVIQQTVFSVQDDGRHEDDVILCGNLQTDPESLPALLRSPKLMSLISGVPTDVQLKTKTCNMIVDRDATVEYQGEAGTFDFLRHFNLSLEEATRLSPYVPVWADFQLIEGTAHHGLSQSPQASR
ncbi:MAG: hypothetical protein U0795_13255 [Pirellulales bacterium]